MKTYPPNTSIHSEQEVITRIEELFRPEPTGYEPTHTSLADYLFFILVVILVTLVPLLISVLT